MFPADPSGDPSSNWYMGASPAKRTALWKAIGAEEYRATVLGNKGKKVRLDVKSSDARNNGNTWYCAASGCGT